MRIVRDAAARGGTVLVPAFAVDRTQELLWILHRLEQTGRVPVLPVYIDSPMAIGRNGPGRRDPGALRLDCGGGHGRRDRAVDLRRRLPQRT